MPLCICLIRLIWTLLTLWKKNVVGENRGERKYDQRSGQLTHANNEHRSEAENGEREMKKKTTDIEWATVLLSRGRIESI